MSTLTDLQRQTLRLYAELISRYATMSSRLVVAAGAECSATGLAAAVNIAGGTSLLVDPSAAAVKAVFRQGGVDFVVNTLDEALRVIKNEIRKHTPLSVALTAEPAALLAEMQERGVQPDLEVSIGSEPAAESLALASLSLAREDGLVQPSAHAQAWLAGRGWSEHVLPAETTAELRALDVRLIDFLTESHRMQWLRRIPHYQRPAPGVGRAVWLTPAERDVLVS